MYYSKNERYVAYATKNIMKWMSDLSEMDLFSGIPIKDIPGLLDCVRAACVQYKKGDIIVEDGSYVYDFGVMLAGHGCSFKEDESGKKIIIALLKKGSAIGVILAASKDHRSSVTVQALDDATVLKIPFDGLLTRCKKACSCHEQLLRNYIHIVAQKGLDLHERMGCLLKSTVREKILTYLNQVSGENKNKTFIIPFDRQTMAEYLNIDRSALSRELSSMKKEGIIDYYKSSFKFLS